MLRRQILWSDSLNRWTKQNEVMDHEIVQNGSIKFVRRFCYS